MKAEASIRVFEKHETGFAVVTDYIGNEVMSAYCPVDILGLKWALLAIAFGTVSGTRFTST